MTRTTLALLAVALATPAFAADPAFKAGVAARVITPAEPVWMAGYAARTKPAEGTEHDLYAKALVVQDAAGKRLVLVTTDLIGIPRPLGEAVAAEVQQKYGIARDELMLTSSHTHCGPVLRDNLFDMYPLTPGEAEKITAYTARLKDDLVAVIGEALRRVEPASLSFGHGKAAFAVNRREPTDKGVINGKNPTGPVDHTVPVLVVVGADGKPRAVVFGYACHNTTLDFYKWCGDYAGFAQVEVENAFPGAVAMFWTGCGADANPQPRRTLELAKQHGKELADAVTATARGKLTPLTGTFAAKHETIPLKFDTLPTREQLAADALSKNLALQKRAQRLLKQLDATGKLDESYPHYPVQVWAFGDQITWVALGGEVVIDYLLRLKKELPPNRTLWVAGYANDVMAYIPSARVLKEGGYEADSSMIYYGMPTKWHPSVEDAIVGKVKELAAGKGGIPPAPGPLSPEQERTTFRLPKGFRIDLVASEPDVVDPVAMCFDERGRLFVCEMRGYPNGGVGTGIETRGKIKCLEDRDGDGVFETATTFAEGLRFPMGVQPYKGGLLVAVAPDLLHLEDTDGDGKADKTAVLYTGFNLANIQQMVNSLQWGLDNWVYGVAGSDGGTITSPQAPNTPPVALRNRGLRFRPWQPGSLEPTSSGGQYGLTADDYQRWFTATNSQHLRQIVLPDHYLRRNPYLPVSAVTLDIPEHGAAAKVFRVSPFEPWRVERTTRRAGGPDAKRFPSTELVPGGFITSACSPLVYTADLLPGQYGRNFVCDPANNLIHREELVEKGAVFAARRVDPDREFLASNDNWFRPVHLSIGPDGAVYVLDFYREVIETPLSLPDDIKKQLNLESRGRGRIWRIAPEGFKPAKLPDVSKFTAAQLADELLSPVSTRRLTAQRLIVERQMKDAGPAIRNRLLTSAGQPARANLVWTLHGLGEMTPATAGMALGDPNPGVRETALRLAEPYLADSRELQAAVLKLVADTSPRVRFQAALSAGTMSPDVTTDVLAGVLERDAADPWTVTAALSSAANCPLSLIRKLAATKDPAVGPVVGRLAAMVGARGDEADVAGVLGLIAEGDAGADAEAVLLDGLGQGMRNSKTPLSAWLSKPPANAAVAVEKLRGRFDAAAITIRNDMAPPADRVGAARLLAFGPFDLAGPALAAALVPTAPGDVQVAAVRSLAGHTDPKVADLLLAGWAGYGPGTRREVLEALFARPDRLLKLLEAVEKKQVAASELDPARVQQLKTHPTAAVRARAEAVLKAAVNPDRAKVVADYTPALDLKGDAMKGRALFKTHCAACHKLDGVGFDVGANLLAALPNKSGEDLLASVLDPNREVDPRYVSYQAGTTDGRVLTGVIAAETPTSVTLRRADGAEDTLLRANLESLRSTKLSLMPEGFEKQLSKQDVADLFAYLRVAGR
ncbi:MAG: neutral/alkaline non-lysosomal ceramidase N-terminal domain-containing protein [Gemmataceae bacterium]|nr:neutral/alkaline non-lysosomal ceramidase N-terminal domain-containing protein [Gemmataceae bacterium]